MFFFNVNFKNRDLATARGRERKQKLISSININTTDSCDLAEGTHNMEMLYLQKGSKSTGNSASFRRSFTASQLIAFTLIKVELPTAILTASTTLHRQIVKATLRNMDF